MAASIPFYTTFYKKTVIELVVRQEKVFVHARHVAAWLPGESERAIALAYDVEAGAAAGQIPLSP